MADFRKFLIPAIMTPQKAKKQTFSQLVSGLDIFVSSFRRSVDQNYSDSQEKGTVRQGEEAIPLVASTGILGRLTQANTIRSRFEGQPRFVHTGKSGLTVIQRLPLCDHNPRVHAQRDRSQGCCQTNGCCQIDLPTSRCRMLKIRYHPWRCLCQRYLA